MRTNKVQLIGNVGKDPEIHRFDTGSSKASFSLATSEKYRDNSGQLQEKTEWHNVVAWGKTAEKVEKYLKKGSKIGLEGKIETRKYQDSDGSDRYITEINAFSILFLDTKNRDNDNRGANYSPSSSSDAPAPGDDPEDDLYF